MHQKEPIWNLPLVVSKGGLDRPPSIIVAYVLCVLAPLPLTSSSSPPPLSEVYDDELGEHDCVCVCV